MSIVYVGMDVHKNSFTLCGLYRNGETTRFLRNKQTNPSVDAVVRYVNEARKEFGEDVKVLCCYEAGCLGYYLERQLQVRNIPCVIVATDTSMNKGKKNDRRDAHSLAHNLDSAEYKSVHIPTPEDEAVREYIRMRYSYKQELKRTKNKILALCLRHGFKYDGKTNWTTHHIAWMKKIDWKLPILAETFKEYLARYDWLKMRINDQDAMIESLAQKTEYREAVKKLCCFMGIKVHTALSLLVEIGDFRRFNTAYAFCMYLGLTPSEDSSGSKGHYGAITKKGNSYIRRLLVEAAQCFSRTRKGFKSAALKQRQAGMPADIIRYADKANERFKAKYLRVNMRSHRNVAVVAVAREMACFIWGMMTDRIA
jgi:transposase